MRDRLSLSVMSVMIAALSFTTTAAATTPQHNCAVVSSTSHTRVTVTETQTGKLIGMAEHRRMGVPHAMNPGVTGDKAIIREACNEDKLRKLQLSPDDIAGFRKLLK